ncbi:MAG: hypothetical protein OXF28_04180 [Thaumarchaeota archaeon]|nr:hypothetical protein [Nitrososphaerota archaeon]MCY3976310.1 hypothetical protein [Nitrososphaerota archaeon]
MKIKCPKCTNNTAILFDDFTHVRCKFCKLDISYTEYIKLLAYDDSRYSDILGDYKTSNAKSEQTLDEWE